MTANKTNRSHRIAYMLVLLAFAIALTTALVLAGERSAREANGQIVSFRVTHAALLSLGDQ